MGQKSRAAKARKGRGIAENPTERRAGTGHNVLRLGLPVAIALVVFLCFLPALQAGFVNWDDDMNLLKNMAYRGLSSSHLAYMFTDLSGHYIPLTWLSFGVDYVIWGMNPFGYHLSSLLLHTANAVAAYYLLFSLLRVGPCVKFPASPATTHLAAAAGALFYAIHPLRVESVVWATERRDVLAGLFFLLTLLAYLRMQNEPAGAPSRRHWYFASIALFLCSLLSKAMGMTLPVVLLAMDIFPLGRKGRKRLLVEKIPYFVLMLAAAVMTIVAQRHIKAMTTPSLTDILLQPGYRLSFYLGKTLMPMDLSPVYPFVASHGPIESKYILCALLIAALTAALFLARKRWPEGLWGWVCHVVLVAPVIGVLQVGPHFAADRNTYFAALPWAAVVAAGLRRAAGRLAVGAIRPAFAWAIPAATAAVLVILGGLSFRQARLWHDSLTLWDHALAIDPNLEIGRNNRGMARDAAGDTAGAFDDYDALLTIRPSHTEARVNRGNAHMMLGRTQAAIADFDAALATNPDLVDAYNGRGAARGASGDQVGAIADYDAALRIKPGYMETYNNRGHARGAQGDFVGALGDFAVALGIDPRATKVYANRAAVRTKMGDLQGAISDLDQVIDIGPASADAFNDRGVAWATKGDADRAIADFTAAIALDPKLAKALNNRGLARVRRGQVDAGVADYEAAMAADPLYADPLASRGAVRAERGDMRGAVADFEHALRVAKPDWPQRDVIGQLLIRARRAQ